MTAMVPLEFGSTPGAGRRQGRRALAPGFTPGFTIVELMTVVAIILILVGIAAIAYRSLDNPASGNSTKVTLQNLQGQLAEYEAAAGLRDQPANMWKNGSLITSKPTNPPFDIWKDEAVMPILPDTDPLQSGNVSSGAQARLSWDSIGNTQRVYKILARIPANKQIVQKLPSKQVLGYVDDTPAKDVLLHGSGADAKQIDPPLVLDAWNNPIIFVGKNGLIGVYVGKKPGKDGTKGDDFNPPRAQRVTSVGTFDVKATGGLPAGIRPFFASAGPDGNFRTGDDNVYSFSQ